MPYADFQATPAYRSRVAGASVRIQVRDEDDPTRVIVGLTTGASPSEQFETLPVEEAGNDGVDEFVQGRHTSTLNIPALYSPLINDLLPSRQSFVGRRYVVIAKGVAPFPNADQVMWAATGAVLSAINRSFGARGLATVDLQFMCERVYTGAEWSALTGS